MFTQFAILFGLMGIGFLSGRLGEIDEKRNEGIGKLLLQVAMPSLLFTSVLSLNVKEGVLAEFFAMILLSAAWFAVFALLAAAYTRIRKFPLGQRNRLQVSMLSTNNAFMGFPIAVAFFGEKGLLLMVAHNLVMNITLFTYGVYKLRRAGGLEITKRKASDLILQILNPNITAIFVGLFLILTSLETLIPSPLEQMLSMLGTMATPLSMIYIGVTLAGSRMSKLFHDTVIVEASIVRLTIFPLVMLAICLLPVIPNDMSQILFLSAMLPTAAIVPVLTGIYAGAGKEEATKIVLFSTILSLVTAPLGVAIATFLF